jgi:phosphoserine aminotransferase
MTAARTPDRDRFVNFSAGPGVLPVPVLQQAQADLLALPGVGASALEVSHRGQWFEGVISEAAANLRALLGFSDRHRVLFCQGGASMQFSMVAMNLLRGNDSAANYVVTGSWGAKAIPEAIKEGRATIAWSGEDDGFVRVPTDAELAASIDAEPAYVHLTTNETIQGVEFPDTPTLRDDVPLVADCSSDFLSRPIDVSRYAVLYAGAQKNAGPAGVTIVIVRDDVLERIPEGLPTMLDYRTYAEHGSLANTPPVFSIYVVMLVTRWLRDEVGGLGAMASHNRAKAALLYDAIDERPDVYRGHADPASRSLMNVTFRLPTEELERRFLTEAAEQGLRELRGHRSVGGIRASIYNAMPLEGVERLAGLMRSFPATS